MASIAPQPALAMRFTTWTFACQHQLVSSGPATDALPAEKMSAQQCPACNEKHDESQRAAVKQTLLDEETLEVLDKHRRSLKIDIDKAKDNNNRELREYLSKILKECTACRAKKIGEVERASLRSSLVAPDTLHPRASKRRKLPWPKATETSLQSGSLLSPTQLTRAQISQQWINTKIPPVPETLRSLPPTRERRPQTSYNSTPTSQQLPPSSTSLSRTEKPRKKEVIAKQRDSTLGKSYADEQERKRIRTAMDMGFSREQIEQIDAYDH